MTVMNALLALSHCYSELFGVNAKLLGVPVHNWLHFVLAPLLQPI